MRIQPSAVLLWGCAMAILSGPPAQAQELADPFGSASQAAFASDPVAAEEAAEAAPPYEAAPAYEAALSGAAPAAGAVALPNLGGYPSMEACPPGGFGGAPPTYPYGSDPAAMSAWPQISPYYGPPYQETYQDRGLWYNDARFSGRKYYLSLEYLRANLFGPGSHIVGSTNAQPFDATNARAFHPWTLATLGNHSALGLRGFGSHGIRSRFAIENSDDTRFEASIFWVAEAQDHFAPFKRGTVTDQSTIKARGGLPLDDGANGLTAPYDLAYDLYYGSQAWGADMDWISTPIWSRSGLKVRGVAGMKFLRINENFAFSGQDSGLGYVFDPETGDPVPGTFVDLGIPPSESDLQAATKSWLAGPEIGLRYEIGGKKLKFWGQSKVGVLVNHDQILLTGNQIGDGFLNPFPLPTPGNPFPSAFQSSRTNTHASEIFDQSLNVEAPLFQYLPILKKQHFLQNAMFRLGYNFTIVNQVLRPASMIEWKTPAPQIGGPRGRWELGTFNVAVDWKF